MSSIVFYSSQKTQKLNQIGAPLKRGFFNIYSVAKFFKYSEKKSHNAEEKSEKGDPLVSPGVV